MNILRTNTLIYVSALNASSNIECTIILMKGYLLLLLQFRDIYESKGKTNLIIVSYNIS